MSKLRSDAICPKCGGRIEDAKLVKIVARDEATPSTTLHAIGICCPHCSVLVGTYPDPGSSVFNDAGSLPRTERDTATRPNFRPFVLNHNLSLRGCRGRLADVLSDINTNAGNSYIAYSIFRAFGMTAPPLGIANLFDAITQDVGVDFDTINKEYSHALLILQDHLGSDWNSLAWDRLSSILDRVKIPVVVFGLGIRGTEVSAQQVVASLSPATVRFYKLLSDKAVSMGIRGTITADALEILGIKNYAVVGCPTYFEAGPGRRVKKRRITNAAKIAAMGLVSNRNTKNAHFVLQNEMALLGALYDSAPLTTEVSKQVVTSYEGYQDYVLGALRAGRVHFFSDIAKWKGFLRGKFDLGIGTHMHGATICLNVDIPVIVTADDLRAREMCELFGIPHFPRYGLSDHSLEELSDMASVYHINQRYDHLYGAFMEWLGKSGLPIGRHGFDDFANWPWTTLKPFSRPSPGSRIGATPKSLTA